MSGPRQLPIAYDCDGCEYLKTDSGYSTMPCTCEPVTREIGSFPRHTHEWCPCLPDRKVIGHCYDCAHCEPTSGDAWLCVHDGFLRDSIVPDSFGCVNFEQRSY